ncbi:hypothetical protein [Cytobacillus firmus]|uniref:hypothetical protein n=1 Tax=Cytobacillus firmus TaxID=1399 RepID=UPI0018CE2C2A|nr:hypothetical protein [Cytobacillus firmus]MBG9653720.1 hypothetical protein [Cytobacillus firmus]MED1904965.1 hypothetical protein [Cytobacillus firmus]
MLKIFTPADTRAGQMGGNMNDYPGLTLQTIVQCDNPRQYGTMERIVGSLEIDCVKWTEHENCKSAFIYSADA